MALPISARALSLRYSLIISGIFLVLGLFLPFWPVLLESRGMDAGEIGLLLAATTWVKIVAVPFWGRVADRRGDSRAVLLFLSILSLLAYLWLGATSAFFLLLLGHLLLGIAFNPMIPLTDSAVLQAAPKQGIDYSRVRLWGSATFILGNLIGGELVEVAEGLWFMAAIIASLLLVTAATFSLPMAPPRASTASKSSWRLLLTDRRFLALVLVAGCFQSSHAAYYAVSSLAWLAEGHSETTIAWLWAEGVLVEILLFAVGSRLIGGIGPYRLLLIAGFAGVLRWSATAFSADLSILIAAQSLHALTFAAAHLGSVTLIARMVPSGAAASGQALYAALQGGVMMGLALLLAGFLFEVSPASSFLAMAGLSGLGLLLGLLWRNNLASTAQAKSNPAS